MHCIGRRCTNDKDYTHAMHALYNLLLLSQAQHMSVHFPCDVFPGPLSRLLTPMTEAQLAARDAPKAVNLRVSGMAIPHPDKVRTPITDLNPAPVAPAWSACMQRAVLAHSTLPGLSSQD